MLSFEQVSELAVESATKVVLIVADGIGGLPNLSTGKTELETASTPNLDRLALTGMCGLHEPVSAGITPGSGPGHLALFGYDPLKHLIGRGVLEGLGIDFPLQPDDIAARGNFCTVDDSGFIVDRRAGRIATEKAANLCRLLSDLKIPGLEVIVRPVREHRFLLVLRGNGLSPKLEDTDPERTGVAPLAVKATSLDANTTARRVQVFVDEARRILRDQRPANMILLRGFAKLPNIPKFPAVYKMRAAAVVTYPMYKGLARVLGMNVYEGTSDSSGSVKVLADVWDDHDYFFVHFKKTDAYGEDGDFSRKVAAIEELDGAVAGIEALKPDVLAVTGDHSTPAVLKGHSWHSVPFLIHSKWCRPSGVEHFNESACVRGNLGIFPGLAVMPLLMAHALKLTKYGA